MTRRGVAVRRSGTPSEVVREATELVDLAISRCRAVHYVDDRNRDRVITVLRATRQDLNWISEEPDVDTNADANFPSEISDTDHTARSGASPIKNGHDQVGN